MATNDTGTDLWTVVGAWEELEGGEVYPYAGPFNYPQVSTVKNPENFEKLIYNRFGLL